jgi:hypothetical protein
MKIRGRKEKEWEYLKAGNLAEKAMEKSKKSDRPFSYFYGVECV